jgi:UDP-2,3-diacylglucosamine hydrolase
MPRVSTKDIKEGAIFIADAHYPHYGDRFLDILKSLESKKLQTPQLFLMGDIFNLLFGYSRYIKKFSNQAITLLQKLSITIDIYYIEGNHDFCLKEIFPNIEVYSREIQPIKFRLKNQDVYLSHGDLYDTGILYNIYTKLLRNRFTLTMLLPLEKIIIDYRIKKLKTKDICNNFKSFNKKVEAIREKYPKDALIIEAHFHQAKILKNYISLPSLACQNRIAIVLDEEVSFV